MASFQTTWRLLTSQTQHSRYVLRDCVECSCILISLVFSFHLIRKHTAMPSDEAVVVDTKGVCAIGHLGQHVWH